MNSNSGSGWKVLLAVVLIALLLGAYFYFKPTSTNAPSSETPVPEDSSGGQVNSVQDIENAILGDAALEAETFAGEDGDVDLINSDSEALDSMGKTYDEKSL